MKTRFAFLVLALTIFASCKEESHKEIRNAFKQYVAENFGNPKDVKEITNVELKDTTSFETFKDMAIQALYADSIVNKRQNSLMDWLGADGNKMLGKFLSKLEHKYQDDLISIIEKMYSTVYSYYINQSSLKKKLEENKNVSEYFIHYVLKVRIEVKGNKEVREYHAYVDKNGKIEIKDREMKKSELPEYWTDLGDETMSLMSASKKRAENLNKLKDLLLNSGITIDCEGF